MVFRNVAVGAWNLDTPLNSNVGWRGRMPALKEAVKRLRQYRDEQVQQAESALAAAKPGEERDDALKARSMWGNATDRFSMLFVAPEYMFMGRVAKHLSDMSADRFLGEQDAGEIIVELLAISAKYGAQLVFLPGSIAFKTPFLKQGDTSIEINARAAVLRGRLHSGAADVQRRAQERGSPISIKDAARSGLSGPLKGLAPLTTNDKLAKLDEESRAGYNNTFIGQNTMYMFHRGKIIGSYSKKRDFHEVLPNYVGSTIFVPGHKAGRATVAGVPLGFEICLDHGAGVLRSTPTVVPGSVPSVHVIISASVGTTPANVLVRDGGYVVHASSSAKSTAVWRKSSKGATEISEEDAVDDMLHVAVMELDFP